MRSSTTHQAGRVHGGRRGDEHGRRDREIEYPPDLAIASARGLNDIDLSGHLRCVGVSDGNVFRMSMRAGFGLRPISWRSSGSQ